MKGCARGAPEGQHCQHDTRFTLYAVFADGPRGLLTTRRRSIRTDARPPATVQRLLAVGAVTRVVRWHGMRRQCSRQYAECAFMRLLWVASYACPGVMHMLIRREASVIIRSTSQQIRQKVGACRAGANIVSACFLVFPYDAWHVPSRRRVAEKIVQTLTLTDIRLRRPTCQPRRRCQRHGSEQIIQTCAVPGVPGTASTTR